MIRHINKAPNELAVPSWNPSAMQSPDARLPHDRPAPTSNAETPVLESSQLFAGSRVVIIEHAGQQYRLLITRNDRLILQK